MLKILISEWRKSFGGGCVATATQNNWTPTAAENGFLIPCMPHLLPACPTRAVSSECNTAFLSRCFQHQLKNPWWGKTWMPKAPYKVIRTTYRLLWVAIYQAQRSRYMGQFFCEYCLMHSARDRKLLISSLQLFPFCCLRQKWGLPGVNHLASDRHKPPWNWDSSKAKHLVLPFFIKISDGNRGEEGRGGESKR